MCNHDSNPSPDREEVRRMLRAAFSSYSRSDLRPLTHEECVEMRGELIGIDPEPFYLGQMLEDLLDTHTDDCILTEDVEYVVSFLNVPDEYNEKFTPGQLRDYERAHGREAVNKLVDMLTNVKRKATAAITVDQAKAICAWLKHAASWKDLERYTDDVRSALEYWEKRAAGEEGGVCENVCDG